jgi:hypothetical protein
MDAYVFGRHDGDLPTHLVGQGVEGNRIRAVARLQGGEHDVFYALEVESHDDIERHVGVLTEAGSQPSLVLRPGPDTATSGPIHLPPPIPPPPMPAWVPPYPWLLFLVCVVDDVVQLIEILRDRLGGDAVAAWQAGDGRYLIEAGATERSSLQDVLEQARGPAGLSEDTAHFASIDEFRRA